MLKARNTVSGMAENEYLSFILDSNEVLKSNAYFARLMQAIINIVKL